MESTVSSQLDYKIYDLTHPTYQYSKVLPVSSGNSYTISVQLVLKYYLNYQLRQ